ncbi:glycosyltransferase [Flagellimonas marinaquae]|uniref:glycosyltransferase n=1 Tax=Flagellimonas marinaquae TaxID=254955 RepID=UPI002074FDC7|nr:glycosyltransferase [Allomuricauda aquimarina]USD24818.1 glycosyltransferase [Allomuricauda aquimarina]
MKIKITFILPSLSAGGAERVMSFVAQNIDPDKFESTLLITGSNKGAAYKIKGINVVFLNSSRVRYSVLSIFKYLKAYKPNIVVSSIAHLNTSLAFISLFFPKTKFIGREANVLSVLNQFKKGNNLFNSFLIKISYRLFDSVICLSEDMMADLSENFGVPKSKIALINNPITDDFKVKPIMENTSNKPMNFITVASLKKQKGHLRILSILSKLDYPYTYTLIGNGPQKEAIFNAIETLKLTGEIVHVPFTDNVSEYLAKSDYFLQGAYVEGFPNCLVESSAVGTPIIAFNAPGGLNEIIEPGVNGYIANTEEEYLTYLNKQKKWEPLKVSQHVKNKFSKENILEKYETLFTQIVK